MTLRASDTRHAMSMDQAPGNAPPRPRVCYLRGSYLNPFEAQYLTPLTSRFDVTLAHPKTQRYDVGGIPLPKQALACVDYLSGALPRHIAGLRVPNPLKFFGFEEMFLGLKGALDGFDIVHVPEQSFYFTWQAARLKQDLGYRLIVTQDEVNSFCYDRWAHVVRRAAFVREQADLFLARTQRARSALITEGVEPSRIRVIGHGVDIEQFRPGPADTALRRELGIEEDHFVILFVGRLVWTKGLWSIADAAARLALDRELRGKRPLFLMVGDGEDRAAFEGRLRRLGVERLFKFTGNQPYERLPELHRLADVFTMPSISTRGILEQFGIALLEAMASGKPVISTHCGAIDEVVGDAGLLVQPNDSLRLYEALAMLYRDAALRRELGEQGRRRVAESFTNTIIAQKLADAYEQVSTS